MNKRVVLVTGAALRIGACIARTFHNAGFNVALSYRHSEQAARALVAELNSSRSASASCWQADLSDEHSVSALGDAVLKEFGRLDILINNASSFYPSKFGSSTQTQWDDLIGSNLRGAYFLSQQLATELTLHQGSIVNLIDIHADRALADHAIYTIAKAGLKAMTKSLAIELAPQVRVNAVAPGAILWPASLENGQDPEVQRAREELLAGIPLGNLGTAQDIADCVYFLACEAHYMTGQTVKVDGGRSLR